MGSLPTANVPRIDISPLFGDDGKKKAQVARAIDAATRDTGFFYAVNHGVDLPWLSRETAKFHQTISDEEKWQLAIRAYNEKNESQVRAGYSLPIPGKKAVESLCYLNPSFGPDHPRIKNKTPMHEVNVWPSEERHPGFRSFAEKYYWDVFRVSEALLRGYALALGKEENFFVQHFQRDTTLSSVVLIRYPYLENYPAPAIKTADDGTKLSFEWHKDVSLITVLYQSDVQNLQVKTAQGWLDIEPDDTGFLVNCGGYMAHITNDHYPAPVHRVKWQNAERQSLPFFVNLGWDDTVQPWKAADKDEASEEQGMCNESISYGAYLQGGLIGLIKKNGQT
ncbi:Isopenicillin N synthase [Emericellopsis cladophorae]|uniref:Isopenicillin N synthase n=1 Tax=Emericellopsis cladophorae TaxID=2686198 RepID=A0A9P9Y1R9_9HYPO|nr:Isopenicillin N synthase [Emericellopsis cladophorae]KAI6781568.1 Isopenicillin N synthase [Emericellopsis cladophorae]